MKRTILTLVAMAWLVAVGASAQSVEAPVAVSGPASAPAKSPCDALAADKKLTGAARDSFLKKCNDDASSEIRAACDAKAADQKLNGEAKRDYVKRCMGDGRRM